MGHGIVLIMAFSLVNFICWIFIESKELDYDLIDRLHSAMVTELCFIIIFFMTFLTTS